MNPRNLKEIESPFTGRVRHYHRAGHRNPKTWEEWVEGTLTKKKPASPWIAKALGIIGILALVAIGVGLFIELS